MWNAAQTRRSALHDARRLRLRPDARPATTGGALKARARRLRRSASTASMPRNLAKPQRRAAARRARASSTRTPSAPAGATLDRAAHHHRHRRPSGAAARFRARSSASPPTASSSCPSGPQRVAVVGGGYIAVELARHLRRRSASNVPLVLRGERVLRTFDADARRGAAREHARRRASRSPRTPCPRRSRATADGTLELRARRRPRARARSTACSGRSAARRSSRSSAWSAPACALRCRTASSSPTSSRPPTCRASMPSAMSPAACSSRRWRSPPGGAWRPPVRRPGGAPPRLRQHPDRDLRPPADRHRGPHRAGRARALRRRRVQVFRSSFVPLYHAFTDRKPRAEMKLVTRRRRAAHRRRCT